MRFYAHTAGGALGALAVAAPILHTMPEVAVACVVAGGIAGPLPDLDIRWAKRNGRWINWHNPWLKHRGPTHSLLAAGLVGLVAGLMAGVYSPAAGVALGAAVFLAWLSHIALDLVNKAAVWVLCPIPVHWRNRHGWAEGTIREGLAELMVVVVALGVFWLLRGDGLWLTRALV